MNTHQSPKKKQLLHQIEHLKSKLSSLPELTHQIQSLTHLIQTLTPSQKALTGNKKIKIYTLKKKLQSKNKYYANKNNQYYKQLQRQENLLQTITALHQQIHRQQDNSAQLQLLLQTSLLDLSQMEEKCKQNTQLLNEDHSILNTYQNEKNIKINKITKFKKIINKNLQSTSNTDSNQLALSFDDIQLSNSNSNSNTSLLSLLSHPSSFTSHPEHHQSVSQYSSYQILINNQKCQTSNNDKISFSRIFLGSLQQVKNEIVRVQESITNNQQHYNKLQQTTAKLKNCNETLKATAKHSKTTVQLLKTRLANTLKKSQSQTTQLFQNLSKSSSLSLTLQDKQAQCTSLRAHLGIKVQNSRILALLNEELTVDLEKIKNKLSKLKILQSECRNTIQEILNLDQNIRLNVSDV